MIRWLCVLICGWMLCSASFALADTPVTLRARVEAPGAMVTLGDVFDGAGAEASRPIAPAPPAGQISRLNPQFLEAAAQAAGLSWTPPMDLREVRVVSPAGMRATAAVSTPISDTSGSELAIRRGESVLLVYAAPGLNITTRVRALEDAAVGQSLRVQNIVSNRIVDAVATGQGAARAAN